MHAVELAGLASTVAASGRTLLACGNTLQYGGLEEFWLCSRFLHECWSQRLAEHRRAIQESGASYRVRRWYELQPLIQEVFLVEPLTRVLAYLAKLCDSRQAVEERGVWSIASNALAIHAETRHRCLHLIVFGLGLPAELAAQLNRLRRCVEDFNDRLMSMLPKVGNLEPFCFDSPHVGDMQDSWSSMNRQDSQMPGFARLMELAMLREVNVDLDRRTCNPRLNRRTYQAVVGCLPPAIFDGFGIPKSPEAWRWGQIGAESSGRSPDGIGPFGHPMDLFAAKCRATSIRDNTPRPRW
jgi:hypothetical protein